MMLINKDNKFYDKEEKCHKCGGTGDENATSTSNYCECSNCDGTGLVRYKLVYIKDCF